MIEKTDMAIYVRDDDGIERLALRACSTGVYVSMNRVRLDRVFDGFVMSPEDTDAVEAWLREERILREAGGPGAGGVK